MTFRTENTIVSQLNFANKRFLANASIVADQTEVGVLTKPNTQGYVVFMLDYLNFAVDNGIENETVEVTLDYVINN
jgi:hypothetical protein